MIRRQRNGRNFQVLPVTSLALFQPALASPLLSSRLLSPRSLVWPISFIVSRLPPALVSDVFFLRDSSSVGRFSSFARSKPTLSSRLCSLHHSISHPHSHSHSHSLSFSLSSPLFIPRVGQSSPRFSCLSPSPRVDWSVIGSPRQSSQREISHQLLE